MRTSLRVLAANMRASVVAICGTRGSGKDSVAAILSQEAGFVNHKLARPLKDAMRGLFSLDAAHVDGELKDVVHPAWGVTPRVLMQWFGTEVMQHELVKVVPSVGRRFPPGVRRVPCLASTAFQSRGCFGLFDEGWEVAGSVARGSLDVLDKRSRQGRVRSD